MHALHRVVAARDRAEWEPTCERLSRGHKVGFDAFVLDPEPSSGSTDAGLDLVGHEHDAVVAAVFGQPRKKTRSGDHEPAFTQHRFGHDAGDALGADLLVHVIDGVVGASFGARLGRFSAHRATVGIGEREAVDLGGEGPEPLLVWHRFRRHGHGQQRAAVESMIEHNDALALREVAGDLDRVLDRLGSGIREHGAARPGPRDQPVQSFGQRHVRLAHGDVETRVREPFQLLAHRLEDRGIGVARVEHRQSGPQIDQGVPIDVTDDRAGRGIDEHRRGEEHAARNRGQSPFEERPRTGARDLGDEASFLCDLHRSSSCAHRELCALR